MLAHRLWRWTNIKTTLVQHLVLDAKALHQPEQVITPFFSHPHFPPLFDVFQAK